VLAHIKLNRHCEGPLQTLPDKLGGYNSSASTEGVMNIVVESSGTIKGGVPRGRRLDDRLDLVVVALDQTIMTSKRFVMSATIFGLIAQSFYRPRTTPGLVMQPRAKQRRHECADTASAVRRPGPRRFRRTDFRHRSPRRRRKVLLTADPRTEMWIHGR